MEINECRGPPIFTYSFHELWHVCIGRWQIVVKPPYQVRALLEMKINIVFPLSNKYYVNMHCPIITIFKYVFGLEICLRQTVKSH